MTTNDQYVVNPHTGRNIKIGSSTHRTLLRSGAFLKTASTDYSDDSDTDTDYSTDSSSDSEIISSESSEINYDDLNETDIRKLMDYADLLKKNNK